MDIASKRLARRKRVFEIIEVGAPGDYASRTYDFFNTLSIIVNLVVSIMYTFNGMAAAYGPLLLTIESVTVAFFAADYMLRLWTARFLRPKLPPWKALMKYIFSFNGIVDILSFLPYYLPFFFPSGAVAFRMFRVMRIFRLFRINAYYDSLNVITEVIAGKRQQLMSSVFIILVLMLASSLCLYSLENVAQPEIFTNAFSGIWWAVSTLLTIGYGDIYPITPAGQIFAIIISFLGVGMVAIPTGIISAGFVDQYSRIKRLNEYAVESDVHFIKIQINPGEVWAHSEIQQLGLPRGLLVAAVLRDNEVIVPRGNVVLLPEDTLVLAADSLKEDKRINLKEIVLGSHHPWNGQRIRDLDISRQTFVVMIRRANRVIIPHGSLMLEAGDKVILYTQGQKKFMGYTHDIEV